MYITRPRTKFIFLILRILDIAPPFFVFNGDFISVFYKYAFRIKSDFLNKSKHSFHHIQTKTSNVCTIFFSNHNDCFAFYFGAKKDTSVNLLVYTMHTFYFSPHDIKNVKFCIHITYNWFSIVCHVIITVTACLAWLWWKLYLDVLSFNIYFI